MATRETLSTVRISVLAFNQITMTCSNPKMETCSCKQSTCSPGYTYFQHSYSSQVSISPTATSLFSFTNSPLARKTHHLPPSLLNYVKDLYVCACYITSIPLGSVPELSKKVQMQETIQLKFTSQISMCCETRI